MTTSPRSRSRKGVMMRGGKGRLGRELGLRGCCILDSDGFILVLAIMAMRALCWCVCSGVGVWERTLALRFASTSIHQLSHVRLEMDLCCVLVKSYGICLAHSTH